MDAAASLDSRQKKPSDASATSDVTLGRQLSSSDVLDAGDGHGHGHSDSGRSSGWGLVLLSFSALGIIYGDIGTSPLYAYQAVFTAPPAPAEVLSAASLFFWTLTLIVLVKYVGIIIRFDDNGEGGTFALYSLMCRAAGFTPFGPAQPEELQLTGVFHSVFGRLPRWVTRGHWWSLTNTESEPLRRAYTRSRGLQVALLLVVMVATAMVVGDGVLTPSISVLSAVSGLKVAIPSLQQGEVIGITIVVLVLLFSVQYMGTAKISAVFAPIIAVWLLFNAGIGFANLSMNDGWGVWKALSPHHGIAAFTGPGGFDAGWRLLAGVMLAITGAEAMYADLGHFNAQAVMLSFCGLVYPCLVVTYMGQAAYLIANPDAYTDPFWKSVPKGAFWPMLIVATAASVVASQALISGVFSIMRQAMNLGVFPPMEVTHTDSMTEGQIYISSINYMLMLGCVAMVAGFQDTTALGHAYGVAVMSVMFMTTILAAIVMLVCYGVNPLLVSLFIAFFVPLEGLFLSSNIIKIPEGGWVTILIATLVASVNIVWWYGSAAKSRWYKAQAERNSGLLAQLPLADTADSDATGGQPLMGAAAADSRRQHRQTGSIPDGSQAWTTAAPTHPTGSITGALTHRRQGAQQNGDLNGTAGGPGSYLWSLSTPAEGRTAAQLAGGVVEPPDAAADADVAVGAKARNQLMSRSWAPGSQGGAVMFNSKPLARLPGLSIIYTQATSGLPAVLQHLLVNMPTLHEVTVLLTIRVIPRPYAAEEERFLVRRSQQLTGMYRVIARYGYMERVDHGPDFVRQLIGCLMRFTTQQPHEQDTQAHAGRDQGASDGALQHTALAARAASPVSPTAAPAALSSGRLSAEAVTIELQPVDETAAAPMDDAGLGLARWSRVPVSSADREIVEELAAAGPDLATRSFRSQGMLSPRASLDLIRTSSSGLRMTPAADSGIVLGRESLNRRQYTWQKASVRKHTPTPYALNETSPFAASAHQKSDGSVPAGLAAARSGSGGGNAATDSKTNAAPVPAGLAAAGVTPAQWQEAVVLLRCYKQRAVYIMGRSQLVAALRPEEADGTGRPRGLAALGHKAMFYSKGVATGAYRVLSNNTHPSSQSWKLPDDQLMLVSMVVRI